MEDILETTKKQIDALLEQKERVIIAIDGKCAAGKTTLAAKLAEYYDCNVCGLSLSCNDGRLFYHGFVPACNEY